MNNTNNNNIGMRSSEIAFKLCSDKYYNLFRCVFILLILRYGCMKLIFILLLYLKIVGICILIARFINILSCPRYINFFRTYLIF